MLKFCPKHTLLCTKSIALLDAVLAHGHVSRNELSAFAKDVCDDIGPVLMAAAQDQLRACHERVEHIRQTILSPQEWRDICILVLGPYMAREGELFLQYFAKILDTPMQGDQRLVYFEGDDLQSAFAFKWVFTDECEKECTSDIVNVGRGSDVVSISPLLRWHDLDCPRGWLHGKWLGGCGPKRISF